MTLGEVIITPSTSSGKGPHVLLHPVAWLSLKAQHRGHVLSKTLIPSREQFCPHVGNKFILACKVMVNVDLKQRHFKAHALPLTVSV